MSSPHYECRPPIMKVRYLYVVLLLLHFSRINPSHYFAALGYTYRFS